MSKDRTRVIQPCKWKIIDGIPYVNLQDVVDLLCKSATALNLTPRITATCAMSVLADEIRDIPSKEDSINND